ncbi:zinc finger BED domain-containing protein 4-like [Tachysurus ichikawai]
MDAEEIDTEPVAKKSSTSVIWRYFGFKITDTQVQKEMATRSLRTEYFSDNNTGEKIALGLREGLDAWDLFKERQVATTTDNGSNIVKAVELNQWARIQCFGHRPHKPQRVYTE